MPTTITPNMSLVLPGVGTQAGPQYATDVNNSLSIIDTHDHTPGNGVLIPTAGINIDNTLSFNTFGASDLQRLSLDAQVSPLSGATYPTSLYASGVDLYFNDGSGNQIQITSSGQVNTATGNITGLSAPAAASYISGSQKFLWQANSGTNLPATMEGASVVVREQVVAGNGVTLSAPTSLAANYTLTFASALPSTTNAITLTNTSGNQSYLSKGSANTVLQMDGTGTNLEYGTIDTVNITDGAVTTAKLAPTTGLLSGGSGGFITTSTTPVAVTGLSRTYTATGRPVRIEFVPASGLACFTEITGAGGTAVIKIIRNTTVVAQYTLYTIPAGTKYPGPLGPYIDFTATAGVTYTYSVEANVNAVTTALTISEMGLFVSDVY